jgi:flagellar biosynthesis protein FlhG
MPDQATILRGIIETRQEARPEPSSAGPHRARTIAVTSGKGGVGKSNIALNMAIAMSRLGKSVCLLDACLGLGNLDLLCGLNGYWNLSHVVTGTRSLKDVVLDGPDGIHVIPGASGLIELADCPETLQRELLFQMEELERSHDILIVDTSTGIHRIVRQFATAADQILLCDDQGARVAGLPAAGHRCEPGGIRFTSESDRWSTSADFEDVFEEVNRFCGACLARSSCR